MKSNENEADNLARATAALDAATRAVAVAQQTIDERRRDAAAADGAIAGALERGAADKLVELVAGRRGALAAAEAAKRDLALAQAARQVAERKHAKASVLAERPAVERRSKAAADRFAAAYEPAAERIVALMALDRALVAGAGAAFARWGKASHFGAGLPKVRGWLAAPAFHAKLRLPCVYRNGGNYWHPVWRTERLDAVEPGAIAPLAALNLDGEARPGRDAIHARIAATEAGWFADYERLANVILVALGELRAPQGEVERFNKRLTVLGPYADRARVLTPSLILRERGDAENIAELILLPALGGRNAPRLPDRNSDEPLEIGWEAA